MTTAPTSDLAYADTLWKSADALRGQIDAASSKHVVLGLLFLKYISDSFQSRRDELHAELTQSGITPAQLEALLESRDEYTAAAASSTSNSTASSITCLMTRLFNLCQPVGET